MTKIALTIGLVLATCFPVQSEEMPLETCCYTSWDTFLVAGENGKDGPDNGWEGQWILQTLTISASGNTMLVPVAGVVLTIDYHGAFAMDYAPAFVPADSGPASPVVQGLAVQSCKDSAVFSGQVVGTLHAPYDMDLDRLNDDGSPRFGIPWMEVELDWAASVKPTLECPGADISVSAIAGPPLGFAEPTHTNNGTVVQYDYSMPQDRSELIIQLRGNGAVTYKFRRLSGS